MSVSIQRKGDRYYVVYYLPDPAHGSGRRQKWVAAGTSKRDAQTLRNKIARDLDRGIYVDDRNMTLAEFLAMWVDERRPAVRESTWKLQRGLLGKHIVPRLGRVKIKSLRPLQIQQVYTALLSDLSPNSVRHLHVILKQALAVAVQWDMLSNNPADKVKPPAPVGRQISYWTREQVGKFLREAGGYRHYELYLAAILTGLRRGELLGLMWEDVDLEAGKVAIRRSLGRGGVLSEPKTRGARRTVAIPSQLSSLLRRMQVEQKEMKLLMGPEYDDSGHVFRQPWGSYIIPDRATNHFRELVSRIPGLPRIRFHDLRHTHATLMLQQGEHPKVVSERLGHASITITLDTYSHVIPSLQEQAVDKLAASLDISGAES